MVHTSVTSVYGNLKQVVLKVTETLQYAIYVHPSALTCMCIIEVYIYDVHTCVHTYMHI